MSVNNCQQVNENGVCNNEATKTDEDKMVYCDLHYLNNNSVSISQEERIKKLEEDVELLKSQLVK